MPTQEEIDAIRTQLIADAASGVQRVVVDGQDTTLASLKDRLDALDRLATVTNTPSNSFGMRITQLISPGCGG